MPTTRQQGYDRGGRSLSRIDERLATAMIDSKREQDYGWADAMLNVTTFAVSEAWQRLEPFLVDPPVDGSVQVALRDSIIRYGNDSASDARYSIAWVRLCCYPVGSEEWEEGRTLALRLMRLAGTESKRAIMHLRYEKAFPGSF